MQHMIIQHVTASFAGVTLLSALAFCQPVLAQNAEIKGMGGSAASRVLMQWSALSAKENKVSVTYATEEMDVRLREMIAGRTDFSATEVPFAPEVLKTRDLLQFPVFIGGVTPIVNIPGVKEGQMRLNADLLARIYMGKIKSWDDPRIRTINPNLSLPKLPIRLIVRGDAASTNLVFSMHLANHNADWKSAVGASKLPVWPAPVERVGGTKEMGEKVNAVEGAIGYVNYDEAFRKKLAFTQLQNHSGAYVPPWRPSFLSAAQNGGISNAGEEQPLLVDVKGASSWPIVIVTYILLDRHPKNLQQARSTLRFFYWSLLQGDDLATESGFIPLPASLQARIVGRFSDVLGPDNAPLQFLR